MLPVIDLRVEPDRFGEATTRRAGSLDAARDVARRLVAEVRDGGDAALCRLTRELDGVEIRPEELRVERSELEDAWRSVGPAVQRALERAASRIRKWHRVSPATDHTWSEDGVEVAELTVPVGGVGVYVPGGRAQYPSTVLMTVIPARAAGVERIAMCVPPGPDGTIPEGTGAAAHLTGVDEVYRVGGAQAIAALAYGTESIDPVDMVVGPGNAYVAMAKVEVSSVVGVESIAGPSECVIVADSGAPPQMVACDLLAQAEHGPGGLAVLVTWADDLAGQVPTEVRRLVDASNRSTEMLSTLAESARIVLCDDASAAMAVANAIAPEHLQLMVAEPAGLLDLVRDAGAVFAGYDTPVTLGDYVAGPSHVLPTGGAARFASALRTQDFRKSIHVVSASRSGLESIGPDAVALATAEGLETHARAVSVRLAGSTGSEVP